MQSKVDVQTAGLQFPPKCPACGAHATVVLPLAKAFLRGSEDEEAHQELMQFEVPFCEGCALRHRQETHGPGIVQYLQRAFSDPGTAMGALIVGGVGLFFFKEAVEKFSLVLLVFSMLPLGTASFLLRSSWNKNPGKFLPKPTSVTSSVDFSDIASQDFEPFWLTFYFRSEAYAQAFRSLNAGRIWDPSGGEAMAARQKRAWKAKRDRWIVWVVVGILGAFALLSWIMGWDS